MDVQKLQLDKTEFKGPQKDIFDMQQKPVSVSSQNLGGLGGAYVQFIWTYLFASPLE